MKTILISMFFISNLYALEISSGWTSSYEKEIAISCNDGEENQCNYLCGSDTRCSIVEGYCRDCAGTSLYLKVLFSEMGSRYHNSKRSVDVYDFFDFIVAGDFITISSKSIYNFVTSYNSFELRMRFQELCGYEDPYPIVFLESSARQLGQIRYVACNLPQSGLSIMEMEERVDVIVNP